MSRQPQEPKPHDRAPAQADGATQPSRAAEERIQHLEREVQSLKDQHLRTLAEVENTKKRLQREKEEFARYASEALVHGLLPIVDSLDQALVAVDKQADSDAIVKGVHLIHRQVHGLLKQEGINRIPTVGERFDPHRHEAMAQVEATEDVPEGTIVEEVRVGYTLHDRVLRPAMVKVAKRAVRTTPPSNADINTIAKQE